jgi:Skp family chaperone for outer membrane proteins
MSGKHLRKLAFVSVMALSLFGCSAQSSESKPAKTHYVVKKVGTKELARAKSKRKVLKKEERKQQAEYDKLKDQLDTAREKQAQQEEQAKQQAAQQKAAQEQAAKRQSAQRQTAPTNRGDMNTAQTGRIVGNVNSHIYHVPGQAGYRMNSANAVYFNSEQEAQAAGYRKALR